jgi:ATP-dependent helicase/DNAse subunit B
METKLVCGRFRPDLEDRLTEEVARVKADDPLSPMLILVGSHVLAMYIEMMLADRLGAHANIRVLTLHDFCARLARGATHGKVTAPRVIKGRILRGITKDLGEDSYFSDVTERPGFISALLATFDDLEQGGFTGSRAGDGPAKLGQVFWLYSRFRERTRDDFIEDSDIFHEASQKIERVPASFGTRRVILYGLYDLTEMQKRLVGRIAEKLEVTFLLPFEDRHAFDYARPALDWLTGIGFELIGLPDRKAPKTNIEAIQSGGSSSGNPAKGKKDLDGTVAILSTPGEASEVREIARELLASAGSRGIPFSRMAVVLRNTGNYLPLIREEFERLGIPYYSSSGLPLANTPEGRSLLLLLELFSGDFPRVKVMEFLRAAPLDLEQLTPGVIDPDEPELWNKISADANIVGGRKQWEKRLLAYMDRADPQVAADDLKTVVNTLIKGIDRVPAEGTLGSLYAPLMDLYCRFVKDSPGREKVVGAVRQLADRGEHTGITARDESLAMVREHLSDSTILLGRFHSGGVKILNIMEARGTSFSLVFIPGMVEKVFPSIVTEDPVLLDRERSAINEAGEGVLPLKRERVGEERLLFALGCSMARERLVLSYPRLDPSTGRPRIPSFFLLQAAEAYTGKRTNYETLESAPGFRRARLIPGKGLEPGESVSLSEFQLAIALAGEPGRAAAARRFLARDDKVARAVELLRSRFQSRRYSEFYGMLGGVPGWKKTASRILGDDRVFRASELEDYANCPYLFFCKRVLRLEKFDEPEELIVIDAATRGSLVHSILYDIFTRCDNEGLLPFDPGDRARHLEILQGASEARFLAAEREGACGLPAPWEREKENILSYLLLVLDGEYREGGRFMPTLFEVEFGTSETSAPVEIAAGKCRLRFKGRIDRIDLGDGGVIRVVDYKTGKLKQGPASPFLPKDKKAGGLFFQTMIYVLAAPSIPGTGERGGVVGENYHISTTAGKIDRVVYGGSDLETHTGTLESILAGIAGGIEKGIFIPRPSRSCDFCDFADACAADRGLLFRRKEHDPAIADTVRILSGELPSND